MNAKEVREALHRHWPDGEYLKLEEVGEDHQRQGRKIDMLVVNLWGSRGLERQAIEIKVSITDFRKEVKEAAKADFWHSHAHRFYIAAPAVLAKKIKPELPVGWGLLSITPAGKVTTAVASAINRNPKEPKWPTLVGMLRCAVDCSLGVIGRAEQRGATQERERIERSKGLGTLPRDVQNKLMNYDALMGSVKLFQDRTGINLADVSTFGGGMRPEQYAIVVNLMRGYKNQPGSVIDGIESARDTLTRSAASIDAILTGLQEALLPGPQPSAAEEMLTLVGGTDPNGHEVIDDGRWG